MRKHDVRKWLHAILDLLPVLVIPLFMIYSSNKNYTSTLAIETPFYEEVDFNQQINLLDYTQKSGETYSIDYTQEDITIDFTSVSANVYPRIWISNNNYSVGDKIYFKTNISSQYGLGIRGFYENNPYYFTWFNNIFTLDKDYQAIDMYVTFATNTEPFNVTFTANLINLTQMFGSGNEPTIEEFNSMYPDDYYAYTLSHKELINVGNQTFNDSDVGSQMFYTLYNSVDKYFNMGNVFNMNGVYNWFVVNIFHGNVAPAIYVVWQVVLYEFVMDLLFLLYGLFMWFIDMVEKLMDKPLKSVR